MSFPLLLLVSLIAGLVGAMTGMGGGVVLIPALTFFGMDIKRAIAISIVSDVELAVGFLLAEGLVHRREDVDRAESCGPPAGPLGIRNLVRVELAPEVTVDAKRLQRNFLTSSSCGLCGKASLDALPLVSHVRLPDGFVVPASAIHDLPSRLR